MGSSQSLHWAMHRRMLAVFCLLILLLIGMICRLYVLNTSDLLSAAAQGQGRYRLSAAVTRGAIYDRDGELLVNNETRTIASVAPTPEAAAALLAVTPEEEHSALMTRMAGGMPFALEVEDNTLSARGIDLFRVVERYGEVQYAPHLIGYLGSGNVGASGIELAYDGLLTEMGGEIVLRYGMDAAGRVMEDTAAEMDRTGGNPDGGVVLTLDRGIQAVTQQALAAGCTRGAAVVMDVQSGDILAMASLPAFDQNNIAASLEREDAPFLNRAVSGYNIGSVFKLVVSACALEQGAGGYQHDCKGLVDVDGKVFRCNNDKAHGLCDMQHALEVSCNCYFIRLAEEMFPAETLLALAENLGLGRSAELAPGMTTQSGNLPTLAELNNPAGYANFSFGQGSSLASPLQIAQVISAIANGGTAVTPRLVIGTTDGTDLTEHTVYAGSRVFSAQTAARLQTMMQAVVEQGSGKPAAPETSGAGGKTSSAQTGQTDKESGEEIVHAWFAGFYPAQQPQYAIAVFVENGGSGEQIAAPIFKQIADGIAFLG